MPTASDAYSTLRRLVRRLPASPRRRAFAAAAAGGVVIAVAAFFVARSGPAPETGRTWRAGRVNIEETISEVGRLEAKNVTMVVAAISGDITWMIEEGTEVKPGDVVLRFSQESFLKDIDDGEQTLVPVENGMEKAAFDLEVTRERSRLKVDLAQLALSEAELGLAELAAKPTADEKAQAELDLKIAELEAGRAREEFESTSQLYEQGLVSEISLKQKKLDALNAEAKREQAVVAHITKTKGATELSLELARAGVEKAKLALEGTRFDARSDEIIAEKESAVASVRLDNSRRDLARRRKRLEDCDVKAPVPGKAVFVNVWKGTSELSPIRVGETRHEGWDLLKIADTSSLLVKLLVNEVDLRRIKLGAPARVRLVAFPEHVFTGKVSALGTTAGDKNEMLGPLALARSGEAGVKVVEITVELDEHDPRMRLGFSADVDIVTNPVGEVLAVPAAAVGREEGGAYCLLWRRGGAVRVPVETGASNGLMIQVKSGLREGDDIVADLAAYGER